MKKRLTALSTIHSNRTGKCAVSRKFCLSLILLTLLALTGCTSGSIFHEGAYVGNGGTYDTQGRPQSGPCSTVPLFASPDVKNDARNRVAMEKSTGRPVAARPVTVNDVIGWRQAGVRDENVMSHIRTHGLYQPLQSQEILTLQDHGVSTEVIRTMKEHPYPKVDAPTPPPQSTGSSFTRFSRNPDTNPGSGSYDYASGGASMSQTPSPSAPTTAPPVLSAGDGKPRMQSSAVSPAYGACVSDGCFSGGCLPNGGCPDGNVILEDGTWIPQDDGGVPQDFIMESSPYCPNCNY